MLDKLVDIARLVDSQTRSISAENPTGAVGGGAQAAPGDDEHCAAAADRLGKGWKMRPCLLNLEPGRTVTLADVEGPGVVQHIWCTMLPELLPSTTLRIYYNGNDDASVNSPLGDFFANGINGLARIASIPVAVHPRGGHNSYWPLPFRQRIRIEITNEGATTIPAFYYQITYAQQENPDDVAYFHAQYRRSTTTRGHPEHEILAAVQGRGHYVGTSLVWNARSTGWWGEGEVKFFMDGDSPDAPTICGTGTEDYFGGAWGFIGDDPADPRPVNFSGPFLGYPQTVGVALDATTLSPAQHGLYRWHLPDPIRFRESLRVTVQALGWWPDGTYQPLQDDIASVAYWYQSLSD